MKTDKHQRWKRVGVLHAGDYLDRFYSGGLSQDGLKYLVSDDERFCVWDIDRQLIIFKGDDDWEPDNEEFIVEWNRQQRSTIPSGTAAGTYDCCEPGRSSRIRCGDIVLRVQDRLAGCEIVDEADSRALQTLKVDPVSDWVSPSISRNGKAIAILEPYAVAFYRQVLHG